MSEEGIKRWPTIQQIDPNGPPADQWPLGTSHISMPVDVPSGASAPIPSSAAAVAISPMPADLARWAIYVRYQEHS